jgi:hypothetical protein
MLKIMEAAPSKHSDYALVNEALEASRDNRLLEWQIGFLATRGCNELLAETLTRDKTIRLEGPELIRLDRIYRIIGMGPKTPLDEEACDFRANVERCKEEIASGNYPGPLLATPTREPGARPFSLIDGNHTKQALKESGFNSWWVTIARAGQDSTAIFIPPVNTRELAS